MRITKDDDLKPGMLIRAVNSCHVVSLPDLVSSHVEPGTVALLREQSANSERWVAYVFSRYEAVRLSPIGPHSKWELIP